MDISTHLNNIIDRCSTSRSDRQSRYQYLRLWYTRGTDVAGPPARYNKIKPRIRLLNSYLYAPESARFSLLLNPADRKGFEQQLETARDAFVRQWRDSGADVRFALGVEWANVYGTTIYKLVPQEDGAVDVEYVDPGSFGVIREDIPSLDRQLAFCHWYHLSLTELENLIHGLSDEEQNKILLEAKSLATPGGSGVGASAAPNMVENIVVTAVSPSSISGVTELGTLGDERPLVDEPLVELCEVWEKVEYKSKYPEGHSRAGESCTFVDWKVSTVLGTSVIIERRNPVLPWKPDGWDAEQPFIAVVPEPYPDYFWGESAVAPMMQLQQWREDRIKDIDSLIKRNLNPPVLISGVAIPDEKVKALRAPGGNLVIPGQQATVKEFTTQLPQEAFAQQREIDQMFDEVMGVPEILQASQQGQMRSAGQVSAMANIAVGRVRQKALVIEDALELIATRIFHLMQRNDATEYPLDGTDDIFLLSQIPPAVTIQVDAHSASPVYAEDTMAKAQALLNAKAIDLPTYVEMVNPPRMEDLRQKAKVLQENQAKASKEMMEIQKAKAERPARR